MNKFHTIEQPESDVTTFILSCDRLDLLERTMSSFLATKNYITKMVILDDSGRPGVFEELVAKYGSFCDVITFHENRGQWWAFDFMVSFCYTPYIFYLEDDWEFCKPDYIQKSKEILEQYRDIGCIDVSFMNFAWQGIVSYYPDLINGSFYNKKIWKITEDHLSWYGWIGSPNLRRRDDLIMLGRVDKFYNEWNIDRKFHALGFRSVYLKDSHCAHIGWEDSKMANRRPDGHKTPEDYFPKELLPRRYYPKMNWQHLDHIYNAQKSMKKK